MAEVCLTGGHDNGQGWSNGSPVRYVAQVHRKLDDGTYPTEATRCFCGNEPKDTVITEFDRYGIPHRMVMCEHCLLMRANPRMTREAYTQFYNAEYRKIYDGFPYGAKSEDDDFLYGIQVSRGVQVKEFLAAFEVFPTSVIDIGCDKGGSLTPFKDDGAAVYGVELCDRSRAYAARQGVTAVASVDDLIAQGVTADLVIMQDIIEHLMDLQDMEKIHRLLAPKGYLFLYTPGLLASDPAQTFQNAHTFQFIGATLEYVMERLGYVAEFMDDRIVSLWKYTGLVDPFPVLPTEWRKFIMEHLQQKEKRALPPVRTKCKFTEKEMLANLEQNLAHRIPTIETIRGTYSGPAVVVGGGPSVDGQLDKIKELVSQGHKLIVIERMYPWCSAVGLKPDFVVSLDASEGVEAGFTHLQPDTIHLLVATNNPKVFPLLKDHKKYIWSGAAGSHPDAKGIWTKYGYPTITVVNTGGSVTLGSIFLALVLGFKQIHLFGFDCMVPTRETAYAAGIAGESVNRSYFEAEVGGETVLTCSSFLSFAQQFFSMMETARQWGMLESIDVYGESLVNKMWDRSVADAPQQDAMEQAHG